MSEEFRVDKGVLGEGRIDHNGNLIVKGVLTRTGVFSYRHIDKNGEKSITRELRHPDDVYDVNAVASFVQLPITDDHPADGQVTPDNVKRYSVGNLGDSLSREGPTDNFVAADLFIRHKDAIDKVMGKGDQPPKRFLSCGYKADVIEENGEYMGEKYDHKQTNIRGNHVALVRNPRAGASACLLLDSADAELEADGDTWIELQENIEQTIEGANKILDEEKLDAKERDALSAKISKIAHENPEWDNDQVVAVAHKMLGTSKKGDEMDHEDDHNDKRVIGKTSRGMDVHSNHAHNDPDDWSVEDHREAGYSARREHDKLRGTLSTIQSVGLGKEAGGKIKGLMKEVKKTHDHHKKEAMTLDSSLEVDDEGWLVDIEDAGFGPGSKGGRVIGHTKSGKPIYLSHKHPSHQNFTAEDHRNASSLHEKKAEEHGMSETMRPQREFNEEAASAHTREAIQKSKKDSMDSDDPKPTQGGSYVKMKRDAETIGSVDNELHLDALIIEVDDDSVESIETLLARQDQLIAFANEQLADAEAARGERDVAMAQVTDPTKLDELAAERTGILEVSEFVGLKRDDLKTVPNDEIKRMVVAHRNPALIKEDSTEDYVQGCYNMIVLDSEKVRVNKQKHGDLYRNATSRREDGADAKPGQDTNDDEPTYREAALAKLKDVHSDNAEQLRQKGFN